MIIYLCIKYKSNILSFTTDIERKLFNPPPPPPPPHIEIWLKARRPVSIINMFNTKIHLKNDNVITGRLWNVVYCHKMIPQCLSICQERSISQVWSFQVIRLSEMELNARVDKKLPITEIRWWNTVRLKKVLNPCMGENVCQLNNYKSNSLVQKWTWMLDLTQRLMNRQTHNQTPMSKLGPVVQRIVSLTSSLVVKLLTFLVRTIPNSQVFLLKQELRKWSIIRPWQVIRCSR